MNSPIRKNLYFTFKWIFSVSFSGSVNGQWRVGERKECEEETFIQSANSGQSFNDAFGWISVNFPATGFPISVWPIEIDWKWSPFFPFFWKNLKETFKYSRQTSLSSIFFQVIRFFSNNHFFKKKIISLKTFIDQKNYYFLQLFVHDVSDGWGVFVWVCVFDDFYVQTGNWFDFGGEENEWVRCKMSKIWMRKFPVQNLEWCWLVGFKEWR